MDPRISSFDAVLAHVFVCSFELDLIEVGTLLHDFLRVSPSDVCDPNRASAMRRNRALAGIRKLHNLHPPRAQNNEGSASVSGSKPDFAGLDLAVRAHAIDLCRGQVRERLRTSVKSTNCGP